MKTGQEILGDLLLEMAREQPAKAYAAGKRLRILRAAFPELNKPQKQIARGLIIRLETRWGLASENPGEINCTEEEKAELENIADWLRRRKNADGLSEVLKNAAEAIHQGIDKLADIQEYAHANLAGRTLAPVSYQAFKDWMIELQIGRLEREGARAIWKPGRRNEFWRGYGSQGEAR